ncbi:MAG: hypothetical protein D6800_12355, partial [Candidatus Zixiibacteriota bacterium]
IFLLKRNKYFKAVERSTMRNKGIWSVAAGMLLSLTAVAFAGQPGTIDPSLVSEFASQVEKAPDLTRMVNAVSSNDINALSLNRQLLGKLDDKFNVKVKNAKVTNQRASGRCWMFAAANVVTPKVMTRLQLSDFKLSKSYLAFWDKLEKANAFLETMIDMRDRDLKDRSLQMYLESPLGDGGWWNYFTDLINKYGVVPASAMPETKQSSATGRLNRLLNTLLRQAAAEIRHRGKEHASVAQLRQYKEDVLAKVYYMLTCAYGEPPKEFTFRYEKGEDSSKTLVEQTYTPMSFYHEMYADSMPQFVAIVNNPAVDYNRLYQLKGNRNIVGSEELKALNLPIDRLKYYSLKALLDSQVVWFACDVGQQNYNDSGVFAASIYQYDKTFGIDFSMPKDARIKYHEISPNHAMVFTGVDTTDSGAPRKWLVENSWGTKRGDKGFWTMYDDWYDQYVMMVIVDKRLLDPADALAFQQKPVVIEDWEPFFSSLARLE